MIRQRDPAAPPVVRGSADDLPFPDGAFEASLAILTIHHWPRHGRGLLELQRVARRRVVILTFDPYGPELWLTDYFPEIPEVDRRAIPPLTELRDRLGPVEIIDVPIPHDCSDGFLGAYWRRPEAYLSADVRAGISLFSRLRDVDGGLARLREDLDSGEWRRRHGHLLDRSSLDLGYRLLIAGTRSR
jgi:SAM-dependent methyltransferase